MVMSESAIPASHGWTSRPPLRHARAGLGAVTVDDHILAIGGFSGESIFDFVESRRLSGAGRWRDIAPMPTPRDNLATAVLGGRVYAMGGADEVADTAVVEIYDPETRRWSQGPALPGPRGAASAAVLDNVLYVAGGGVGPEAMASMVVLDPKKKGWRSVAPMPTPRFQLRLVASGRYLYAIGGRAPGPSLTTVERYDPEADRWRAVRPLLEARAAPGVVATKISGRRILVVAGGAVFGADGNFVDGRRTTEIFDVDSGRWKLLGVLFPRTRASFGCAVDGDGAVLAIGGGTHVGGVFEFLRDVDALTLS